WRRLDGDRPCQSRLHASPRAAARDPWRHRRRRHDPYSAPALGDEWHLLDRRPPEADARPGTVRRVSHHQPWLPRGVRHPAASWSRLQRRRPLDGQRAGDRQRSVRAPGAAGHRSDRPAQRTREVGIRMALGAQRGQVVRLVLRYGAVRAALGISLGVVAALAATRALASMLVGVRADDPITYVGVAALLAVTALAASWVPARRAARVDPMVAIRAE